MDITNAVKLLVIILLCLAVIAGVVFFSQGASLINAGMTNIVLNAGNEAPWGMGATAANWALGRFAILLPLQVFVTFGVSVAALVGTWKLFKMFV